MPKTHETDMKTKPKRKYTRRKPLPQTWAEVAAIDQMAAKFADTSERSKRLLKKHADTALGSPPMTKEEVEQDKAECAVRSVMSSMTWDPELPKPKTNTVILRAITSEWRNLKQEHFTLSKRLKTIEEDLVPIVEFIREAEPNLLIVERLVDGP
jgi:hypothetical protein